MLRKGLRELTKQLVAKLVNHSIGEAACKEGASGGGRARRPSARECAAHLARMPPMDGCSSERVDAAICKTAWLVRLYKLR